MPDAQFAPTPTPAPETANNGAAAEQAPAGRRQTPPHPAIGRNYADGAAAVRTPADPQPVGRPHVVAPGETLWSIADQELGEGALWPKLWAANRSVVPDKDRLTPGMQLTVPRALEPRVRPARRPGATSAPGPVEAAPSPPSGPPPTTRPQAAAGLSADQLAAAREWYDAHPLLYQSHTVRRLQAAVGVNDDGVVGPDTVRAVAAWQAGRGLDPDGIAGPATMTALFGSDIRRAPRPREQPTNPTTLLTDAEVRDVVAWYGRRRTQYPPSVFRQLEEKLEQPGNGLIDAATVRAIAAWQKAHGLQPDGIAGPATLEAMFGRDIRMGREQREDQRTPSGPEDAREQRGDSSLSRPNGITQIQRVFGRPGTQIVGQAMRAGRGGEMRTVYCHAKLAPVLTAVFEDIHKAGMSEHIKSFGGCYVYRKKRSKGTAWSTHAWGIAVDVNAEWNPMVKKRANMQVSDGQRILLPFFEARGFYWGGHFGDPMHFQYCTGY